MSGRRHKKLIGTPLFVPTAVGFLRNSGQTFTYTVAYVPFLCVSNAADKTKSFFFVVVVALFF